MLTKREIDKLEHKEKFYTKADGRGLFIKISKNSKRWIYKYQFEGKDYQMALGLYPLIDVSEARVKRDNLHRDILNGINPSRAKKDARAKKQTESIPTLGSMIDIWLKDEFQSDKIKDKTYNTISRMLTIHTKPISQKPINEIDHRDIKLILKDLLQGGKVETAKKIPTYLSMIFKYAIVDKHIKYNIIQDLNLKTIFRGYDNKKNHPTFTKDADIQKLLNNIDIYKGSDSVKNALRVMSYTFVRSANIREMEWDEIDLSAKTWTIPSNKMKMKEEFIIPLPPQVTDILEGLDDKTKYVFPSNRGDKPLSSATLINAIRVMGYSKEEFTPHGFRSMFSTMAYEFMNEGHGYTGEVIEALLAHKETNQVKGAYNRATYTESMRGLISWYADRLDTIKRG